MEALLRFHVHILLSSAVLWLLETGVHQVAVCWWQWLHLLRLVLAQEAATVCLGCSKDMLLSFVDVVPLLHHDVVVDGSIAAVRRASMGSM